jgi:hypothetical protein
MVTTCIIAGEATSKHMYPIQRQGGEVEYRTGPSRDLNFIVYICKCLKSSLHRALFSGNCRSHGS